MINEMITRLFESALWTNLKGKCMGLEIAYVTRLVSSWTKLIDPSAREANSRACYESWSGEKGGGSKQRSSFNDPSVVYSVIRGAEMAARAN